MVHGFRYGQLYATAQQVTSQAVIRAYGICGRTSGRKAPADAQMLSMVAGSDYLHRNTVADQL